MIVLSRRKTEKEVHLWLGEILPVIKAERVRKQLMKDGYEVYNKHIKNGEKRLNDEKDY